MKKIINILILIALLVLIGLKLKENKKIVADRIFTFDKEAPIKVISQKITSEILDVSQLFTGTFEAHKEVKVTADVQGKIVGFYVNEGQFINKGKRIVKLDDSLLKIQLQQVEVQIETLHKDLARYQILTDADAIPGVKLEKVQQGIKTANTQKQTILTKIKKTVIYAPFSGVVTMKFQEVGAFAAPGVPLILLTDMRNLNFKVNVSEQNLSLFKKGTKHNIKVATYPNLKIVGKVSRIGSKGNMGNNFPVEFAIKNTKDRKLKSKMFGKVLIKGSANTSKVITIDAKAIVGSEVQPQVYVIKDKKAILTDISIGNRTQNKVVINTGLNEGDQIITSGFINLFDGAHVSF